MTTSYSDAQQIDNLLSDTTLDSVKYNDAQWSYVSDINNSSYQDRIIFSTTVLKQQLIDYHSAFLTIPLCIQRAQLPTANGGSATLSNNFSDNVAPVAGANPTAHTFDSMVCPLDYTNAQVDNTTQADPGTQTQYVRGPAASESLLCFRDSILNLICGLIVQTDNGQAIVNELGRLDFINNLRLKIENSIDWTQTMGSLLHFSMDTVPTSAYVGKTDSTATAQVNPRNNSVNPFLPDQNLAVSGVYSGHILRNAILENRILTPDSGISAYSTGTIEVTSATTGAVTGTGTTFTAAMVGSVIVINSVAYIITQYSNPNGGDCIRIRSLAQGGAVPLVAAGTSFTVFSQRATVGAQIVPVAIPNPGFNKGVWDRVQIFQNSSVFVPGNNGRCAQYHLVAKIPLRLLHDFFEQLDFPVINMGFNFQFILRQTHNSNQVGNTSSSVQCYQNCPPLMGASLFGPSYSATQTFACYTAGMPSISYGQTLAGTYMASYGTQCRLYYRSIKLNPSENEQFKARLMRGFTKKIKFISTDIFQPQTAISTQSGNFQIAPSIVWPLRVWALLYTTNGQSGVNTAVGALGGNWKSAVPAAGGEDGRAPMNGLQVVHGWLRNANIMVNNQPYFKNNLQTVDDFWLQLKDQFNRNTGSMISYTDFVRNFRYHCFDISRLSDRLPSKTEAVSLSLTYDRADNVGQQCDLVVLIERMNQVQFDFSASDVAVTVGNITA
jgi:hypothetical protein